MQAKSLAAEEYRPVLSVLDRGCVEDQPQKATFLQGELWGFSRRISFSCLLRLVFDIAALLNVSAAGLRAE
jgi:hypothetical protein